MVFLATALYSLHRRSPSRVDCRANRIVVERTVRARRGTAHQRNHAPLAPHRPPAARRTGVGKWALSLLSHTWKAAPRAARRRARQRCRRLETSSGREQSAQRPAKAALQSDAINPSFRASPLPKNNSVWEPCLNVFPIHPPPLRQRRDDVLLLAETLLARLAGGSSGRRLSPEAADWLRRSAYPGNVRESRHTLARARLPCAGDEILLQHLPLELATAARTHPSASQQYLPEQPDSREREAVSLPEQVRRLAANARLWPGTSACRGVETDVVPSTESARRHDTVVLRDRCWRKRPTQERRVAASPGKRSAYWTLTG